MKSVKHKISSSLFWRTIEKLLVNGSQFIISLILARLLLPSDYGTIALLTIFIALSQVLIEGGFTQIIIQKQQTDKLDFSTMFCCNLFTALIIYSIIFLIAPYVAIFYKLPELSIVMRIYCITLIINSLYVVRKTQYVIALKFREQAYITFLSILISGIVGVYLALEDYGVWALVYQQIGNSILMCLLYNRFNLTLYSIKFSKNRFYLLFGKGSRLLIANILQSIYSSLYSLLIGKFFSTKELGLFSRGNQMGQIIPSNVTDIFANTVYPIFCQERNNTDFSRIYIKYIRLICFIFFPCMVLISTLSFPLIEILLGNKWLECAIYMKIVCIAYAFDPIMRLNSLIPTIMGQTNTTLKTEIVKKIIAIMILFIAATQSVLAVCYGIVLYALFDIIISTHYNKKFLGITVIDMFISMKNAFIISTFQFIILSYALDKISNPIIAIIVAVLLSIFIILTTSLIFKLKEFKYVLSLLSGAIYKR